MKKLVVLASLAVLGFSLGIILAGCGSDDAVSLGPPPRTGPSEINATPTGTSTVPTSTSFEVWFASGERLVAERRTHTPTLGVAAAALEALLAGPTRAERASGVSTAVPAGTRLLSVSINGGIATVDLTSEYQSGGGSFSMQVRLGQVVYTLTQFPTVKKVRFQLDGAPVNVFSGEGIVLDHPVGRSDYEDLLPAIAIDTPPSGTRVTSPVRVSGSANVFEANVTVQVLDENGQVVGKTFTTATCGTGCRGAYSALASFRVDREQRGTIVVSDDDAAGTGTPPHVVRAPVVLRPR